MSNLVKYNDLPKGARFKYQDSDDVWVLLQHHENGLVAAWNGNKCGRSFQSLCSAVGDDIKLEDLIVIPVEDELLAAIKPVLRYFLDCAEVHVCDNDNDDIKIRQCPAEVQALYALVGKVGAA
jgi:hypothetical protein